MTAPAPCRGRPVGIAWWDEALADPAIGRLEPVGPTDPETPYMIIYTSGTTGRPKGAVHVHGGFPIKGAQDLAHRFDLRSGRRPVLVHRPGLDDGPVGHLGSAAARRDAGALRGRARLSRPRPPLGAGRTPRRHPPGPLADRHPRPHGPWRRPGAGHDLLSLRVLGSTGEPWNPEPWWWFFREVGEGRCPIINYSGGTEVSGGIVSGNLLTPIKPCGFGGPSVGTAADVIGPDGNASAARSVSWPSASRCRA